MPYTYRRLTTMAALLVAVLMVSGACGNRRDRSEALEVRLAAGNRAPAGAAATSGATTGGAGTADPVASGDAGAASVEAPSGQESGAVPTAAPSRLPASSSAPVIAAQPQSSVITGGTAGAQPAAAPGRSGPPPGPAQGPAGGGAATPAPAAPVPGPTRYDQGADDHEIKFASISSLTGLVPDFMQPRGARAYFKYVNALGGVNGRKLTLLIYDDQWDVTRNAALTRQALESDKV